MNDKVYKWCAVPLCKNTSKSTPDKLFVYVPNKKKLRYMWLRLARRDPTKVVTKSSIYFCEDHFDMPNDMENYMQYRIMGYVSQVRMKPGCMPSKFECQPNRKRSNTEERPYILKKQKSNNVTEHVDEIETGSSGQHNLEELEQITENPKMINKSIQVHLTRPFRSKALQTQCQSVTKMTSPLKPHLISAATSPFKIKHFAKNNPSSHNVNVMRRIFKKEERSDSDTSYTPSVAHPGSSPSTKSFEMESASDCSELLEEDKKQETIKILDSTLKKIMNNPRFYIGIPKNCYHLLNIIEKQTSIPINHILLCLKKIRLNNSFRELADEFAMDATYASRIFSKNIPILASVIRPFIVTLDIELIKKNLPMAFRHRFHKVSCIIDCLEIEIQKPSKAVNQALTWSDYKKANTIKYLVSCTPNGLVNFISPGYGGRITDTCLVETCDFVKCLQQGMCVMADRGFKHVEVYLRQRGMVLVRPPSVQSGTKFSKAEAKETKQIASLRIHIERVIRRLREYSMLKPHACLNLGLVKVLDDVITIACGLINLQDSLIK
ncbi:uncharacterized protein LOC106142105 [Amyelois transitella]|uniref:uncharacterized protein LOC106142105 n=1 Tax=Amyelois transitella TaxID=680683 RepID=UPI0029906C83|nr:uncharacterized protein LOC106142105 [Amyelois transitella]